jgi:hypothetical protein
MKLDAIEVTTIFVPNLAEVRIFYLRMVDAPIVYEDDVSTVFGFVITVPQLCKGCRTNPNPRNTSARL